MMIIKLETVENYGNKSLTVKTKSNIINLDEKSLISSIIILNLIFNLGQQH